MSGNFTLFGQVNPDGSLVRLSPSETYDLAVRDLRYSMVYEHYELTRRAMIRDFAQAQLLGPDQARFLRFAEVPEQDSVLERREESDALREAHDALYGDHSDSIYVAARDEFEECEEIPNWSDCGDIDEDPLASPLAFSAPSA